MSMLVERGAKIVWPTRQVQVTVFNAQPGAVGYAEIPDMLAIFACLHRDALLKQVEAAITSEADDAASLNHEERQRREAEVMSDLLAVERDESAWSGPRWRKACRSSTVPTSAAGPAGCRAPHRAARNQRPIIHLR